jgi:hypothetical protein
MRFSANCAKTILRACSLGGHRPPQARAGSCRPTLHAEANRSPPPAKMVIGAIGVLYGVAVLLSAIFGGLDSAPSGTSGYGTGQVFGLVIAAVVLFYGARYARRGLAERGASRSQAVEPIRDDQPEIRSDSTPPPTSSAHPFS